MKHSPQEIYEDIREYSMDCSIPNIVYIQLQSDLVKEKIPQTKKQKSDKSLSC